MNIPSNFEGQPTFCKCSFVPIILACSLILQTSFAGWCGFHKITYIFFFLKRGEIEKDAWLELKNVKMTLRLNRRTCEMVIHDLEYDLDHLSPLLVNFTAKYLSENRFTVWLKDRMIEVILQKLLQAYFNDRFEASSEHCCPRYWSDKLLWRIKCWVSVKTVYFLL